MMASRPFVAALLCLATARSLTGQTDTKTPKAPTPPKTGCRLENLAACTPCEIRDLAKTQQSKADRVKAVAAQKEADAADRQAKALEAIALTIQERLDQQTRAVETLDLQTQEQRLQDPNADTSAFSARVTTARKAMESLKAQADGATAAAATARQKAEEKQADANAAQQKADSQNPSLADQLKNLHFGLGLGVLILGHDDIVATELTGDHIVRVTDQEKAKAGIWLDLHYPMFKLLNDDHTRWGAFVAVQLANTSGDTLNSVAFGPLFSWKVKPICDDSDKSAFNIGLGAARTKIQTLGPGIVENRPLPTGEQQVRYKKISVWGVVIMFSFNVL